MALEGGGSGSGCAAHQDLVFPCGSQLSRCRADPVFLLEFLADFWCDPDKFGSESLNRVHRIDRIRVQRVVVSFEVDGPDHATS